MRSPWLAIYTHPITIPQYGEIPYIYTYAICVCKNMLHLYIRMHKFIGMFFGWLSFGTPTSTVPSFHTDFISSGNCMKIKDQLSFVVSAAKSLNICLANPQSTHVSAWWQVGILIPPKLRLPVTTRKITFDPAIQKFPRLMYTKGDAFC